MINRTPFVGHSISITQTRALVLQPKAELGVRWRAASVGGVGCGQEGEEEEEESWMKGKRGPSPQSSCHDLRRALRGLALYF